MLLFTFEQQQLGDLTIYYIIYRQITSQNMPEDNKSVTIHAQCVLLICGAAKGLDNI